ncbi:MAG: RIP metalloprotease RseP [Deferribacterota bacterium]|nr:RIP metalloprotease RseP [Deferribacterota bacterium]
MIGIISAILVFALLIFIHELGHFIVAKLNKVYVERFSIGFGPIIYSKNIGETEYAISLLPLGGYVKMYGEDPTSEVDEKLSNKAFSKKPLISRILIVSAGPIANFFLAVVLFFIVFMIGVPKLLPIVGEVKKDMPAYGILENGDKIISINGKKIKFWEEMSSIVKENPDNKLTLEIERKGQIKKVTITPSLEESQNIFGEKIKVGLIGITPSNDITTVRYNPLESLSMAVARTYEITKLTLVGIVKIFQRVVPADNIGGPILIFQMAKDTAEAGLNSLLVFTSVISINLAILNLLPIPVLDGGHLFFYFIEAIRRKPVSLKAREVGQIIGLALILALTFFAFYNDIIRIIKN